MDQEWTGEECPIGKGWKVALEGPAGGWQDWGADSGRQDSNESENRQEGLGQTYFSTGPHTGC